MADYLTTDTELTSIANAIRTKGGTSASLEYPSEFISAIENIPTGSGTGAISIVDTADSAGGTVRTITAVDISDTTAIASDVASGKYFYTADGTKTAGTASGGSSTHHVIHFEFTDSTDADIDVYYTDSLLETMITAYTPTTYGQKTVSLAQLDGVTWYEPSQIPIGVELIDSTKLTEDYAISSNGQAVAEQWYCISDFTPIESGMTFSYSGCRWYYLGFYDASKEPISTIYIYNDTTESSITPNLGDGTLSGNEIPSNAAYIRITGVNYQGSYLLSLIRTA